MILYELYYKHAWTCKRVAKEHMALLHGDLLVGLQLPNQRPAPTLRLRRCTAAGMAGEKLPGLVCAVYPTHFNPGGMASRNSDLEEHWD